GDAAQLAVGLQGVRVAQVEVRPLTLHRQVDDGPGADEWQVEVAAGRAAGAVPMMPSIGEQGRLTVEYSISSTPPGRWCNLPSTGARSPNSGACNGSA